MKRSEQLDKLAAALAKAQGEMENASKDKVNPHFKAKYADLSSVWDAIRDPLSKNGLSVVQLPDDEGGGVKVTTILLHASGQYIEASYALPATKPDAQGYGSAITYMKRYALTGMGVAPEDDDGQAASVPNGNGKQTMTQFKPSEPTQPPKAAMTADTKAAAIKWASDAKAAIRAFDTLQGLKAWADKHDHTIVRLEKIDAHEFDDLQRTLSDAFERLNPLAAE